MILSAFLPIVIILMLLTGTSTGRTIPSKCSRSDSNSPYSTESDRIWQCGDGYCVGRYYLCDGILDCLNVRDEFNCQICRGESFHCDNRRCIAIKLHCNGIDECGDGSDEPWTCPGTINAHVDDILKNTNIGNIYGSLFGYAAGVIILIFGIITAIGATITVCACKKSCPLYKWRKRREEPPVGVIVAEPNQLYQDQPANLLSEPGDQDPDDENLIRLIATSTHT